MNIEAFNRLAALAGEAALPIEYQPKELPDCLDCKKHMIPRVAYERGLRTGVPHYGRGLCLNCRKQRERKGLELPPLSNKRMIANCKKCGIKLIRQRKGPTPEGVAKSAGHGLCCPCYRMERADVISAHRDRARAKRRLLEQDRVSCSGCKRDYGSPGARGGFIHLEHIGKNLCQTCAFKAPKRR